MTLRKELLDIIRYDMCESCGKRLPDVRPRANAYEQEIGNDTTAMHTVCDECDYQNRMDI